jgi:NAD(P)-dependent dehydrogenase (short-subunit alcohol dehydrogenase family)
MAMVLITGGSRGIGFGIVRAVASRVPESTVIIGSRSNSNGEKAVQQLRELGIGTKLDVVQIDIEDDDSIQAAVSTVDKRYGCLDGETTDILLTSEFANCSAVLINNAGQAELTNSMDLSARRAASNKIFNNCITSNALVTHAFTPLLRKSKSPKVIMTSSARGSLERTAESRVSPIF